MKESNRRTLYNIRKAAYDVENLIPFAIEGNPGEEEPTEYACFVIDGLTNRKVRTVWLFGANETFLSS